MSGSVIGFLVLTTISSGVVFVVYRIPTVSMEPTLPVNCSDNSIVKAVAVLSIRDGVRAL